jgi:hypothetical protein
MCGGGRGEGADSVISPPKTQGWGGGEHEIGTSERMLFKH